MSSRQEGPQAGPSPDLLHLQRTRCPLRNVWPLTRSPASLRNGLVSERGWTLCVLGQEGETQIRLGLTHSLNTYSSPFCWLSCSCIGPFPHLIL